MNRKLRITESERKEILSYFNQLLNEEEGLASLKGTIKYKGKPVPDTQIKLFKDDRIFKGVNSDDNGNYLIEDIPLGDYKIVASNKLKGYDDVEEDITLSVAKTYISYIAFRETQESQEVNVKVQSKRFTIIDVQVLDNENEPLGPCNVEIFDVDGKRVRFSPNKTDSDGLLELISISDNTPNFKAEGKAGQTKTKITVRASFGNISETKEYEIVLNNGISKETGGSESIGRIYRKDEETDKVLIDLRNTNKLTINLNVNLNYTLSVVDGETDELLKTASINLYRDKEMTDLIQNGLGEISGTLQRDQKTKKEGFENTTDIYYEVSNDGYVTQQGKLTISKRKTNNFKISLSKVPPPPTKELNLRECMQATKSHYRNLQKVDNELVTIKDLGGIPDIEKTSEYVTACLRKFREDYPKSMKKFINGLIYVDTDLTFFKMKLTQKDMRDIYGESKSMTLSNTIRKVISESIETKNLLSEEKKLVEKRLLFSLNGVRKNNINEAKTKLKNERVKLIRFGYNEDLVNESFLDVMKGLYGNEGTDVLTDIKTRLGQKIADQVKNKQEEHEMILSAFNELPVEMIERAIKENRVDELSGEISTKALENYKTQFGTEGLSGIMIASVDENKFKQEVAKLLDPAIKDITTKMDEKLKQVQNVVSGGVNPTA